MKIFKIFESTRKITVHSSRHKFVKFKILESKEKRKQKTMKNI